ncbi:ABC transporter permease [Mesorhizobium sp. M2D.F.Ca.ET.185.01.1.1]|uniref:ABC transporter permease n=1 Tax=unclassified Mesorhizobium TaxID=325217 RepID=UPI000FCA20AC|nr:MULTISPECIES: ABC transporter permease [unclassified Mesorhizobium]TGP80730.1 ABC transporter permease [bacterium M00.F.Ca.ET.227.01.1.1]TGP90514.1 ABC transporter permease [bacterium M00.F.Ca.ET.221.01.1.1]TGP97194.1 ABC transporter permease [bacterium M00.F.Ca.ET.222.01.1.1]TGT75726.1 ABC transporter permease [bacterium M00.F.Ca.ET.159.01.1.1]TGT84789.1 ABC transporter permease [bacterium M00.F.Ca.ET.157.01.1.1]TGT96208.1 ABC transporter permease [bacterium M00.F.Ca.ET.163.01.1.1]TGU260
MRQAPLSPQMAIALPALGAASILIAWQYLLPLLGVPAYIVPTPTAIFGVFQRNFALLIDNLRPTLIEALAGFVIGNLAAVLLAVLFVHSRILQAAYFPIVLFFNTIPILALSPIIILIFGIGMTPKIVIAAVICFFPTLVNMIRGLDSAGDNEHELFRVLSATRSEIFWGLRLPRALPMLFSSLRIASATAIIGAIVGEWIGSDKGLGALIIQATFNYQSDRLYAAIVLSSSLSIALFCIVVLIERRVIRY